MTLYVAVVVKLIVNEDMLCVRRRGGRHLAEWRARSPKGHPTLYCDEHLPEWARAIVLAAQ